MYKIDLEYESLPFYAYCNPPEKGKKYIDEKLIEQIRQLFQKYNNEIKVVITKGVISLTHYRSDTKEFLMLDARLKDEISESILLKFREQVKEIEEMIKDISEIG